MVQRGGATLVVAVAWSALAFAPVLATVSGCAEGSQSDADDGATVATTASTGGAGGEGAGGFGGAGGEGGAPPVCSEDPCKLTLPQCGCDEGEACVRQTSGRVCVPAGDKQLAEACSDDCVAGHQCLANPTFATPAHCMKWCESDDDCVGPGALCLFTITGETTKLCSINCDPVSSAGCPAAGAKCDVLRENMGLMRWLTSCVGEGAGVQETPCTATQGCADGYGCFNVTDANMMTTQMCLRWCNLGMPTSCPGGSQCAGFQTPIVIGSITYGACVPTG
jgi:hypothetical protein